MGAQSCPNDHLSRFHLYPNEFQYDNQTRCDYNFELLDMDEENFDAKDIERTLILICATCVMMVTVSGNTPIFAMNVRSRNCSVVCGQHSTLN